MPIGTQFTNSAAIYFDFNEPVITNTTINTLSEPTSTNDINSFKNGYAFMLYPNPANDICYVRFNVDNTQEKVAIRLADITGKNIVSTTVSLAKGEQIIPITTSVLTAGVYFVTVGVNDASSTQKLIITK